MLHLVTLVADVIPSTYLFLRILLHLTQDAREPPVILTGLPFVSPLIGIVSEKSKFHIRLRNNHRLPIYTFRLPFQRMYIFNSIVLIPLLQKQWRTVSFVAIAADAGFTVGMSKEAVKVMHQDLTSEHGFSVSLPRYIVPAMSPGKDLDAINRPSVQVLADEMKTLKTKGTLKLGLSQWSRQIMVTASTFEAGFLTFSMFPLTPMLFPKLLRARETVAAALIDYMRKGGHESASGLVRLRYEHHHARFGLNIEDIARGELGNTFAVLGNTTPCALCLLYHIFSDGQVLADVRREISALVYEELDTEDNTIHSVDLAAIRTSSPILLSTFKETLRFRAVNPGPCILLEDVNLDGCYLLRKGSVLMIPATVQHNDMKAWGDDAGKFDHMRFVRKPSACQKKLNRVAFRAFGGGHILCPGRHFASTETMALGALLVLQFDVVPVRGKWVEPVCDNSPAHSGFPVPDEDIEVEIRSRDAGRKWNISFSGLEKAMDIVSEDSPTHDSIVS